MAPRNSLRAGWRFRLIQAQERGLIRFGLILFRSLPPNLRDTVLRVWWVGRVADDEQRGEDGKEEEEEARLIVLLIFSAGRCLVCVLVTCCVACGGASY